MSDLAAPSNPIGANRLFEYCCARIYVDWPTLTAAGTPNEALNALGFYGWELVAILPTNDPRTPCGFFRRDLIDTPPGHYELLSLEPASAVLGSPSFTMRVLGAGFTPESVIVWNGADEVTTFVSPTELQTGVNMATAEVALSLPVLVRTGTVESNPLVFTFLSA